MLDLPNLQQDVILAPYTTYKIGGPAEYFFEANSAEDLVLAVTKARKANIPYFILGCGANILIRDKGIKGLVILNRANHFEFTKENQLKAESGAIIAELIEASRERGLSGLEHFVGIPSTVGGAIWQNLHFLSPDRESTLYIEQIVIEAKILDEDNQVKTVDRDFFRFGYDDSILHHRDLIVLEVIFQLTPKPKTEIQKQMDENMAWRIAKQPQLDEFPSCGSVFKKIEGVGAGRLIDQAGLKGTRIGNAEISTKHANYIVNLGGATAADVLDLIKLVQLEVKRKLNYEIEPEIRIVGER
jgi:UDP-N-acetylmuramate dehydrogenase